MPDPSAFGPASAGQPDPAADGALEPGRFGAPDPSGFGTPEPKDNGLPTRTVTGLPVSDGDPRVTAAELTDQGLPVRVRQASLAPQLRNSSPPRPPSFIPSGLRPVASPSGLSPSAASPTGDSSEDIDSDGTGGAGTPPPRGIDVFAAANRPADPAVSPEAARNTVSALQRGWQLGRAEAAEATSPGQSAGESAGDSDNAGPDQDFDSDGRRTD
jgi:hypothetical protein